MLAYDLCCGAGGSLLGLSNAGYDVVGWELDPLYTSTAMANGFDVIQKDINDVDWSTLESPDVIVAGVPCQPFSLAGRKLGLKDLRDCFPAAIRAVTELEPRVVVFENVRNIMSKKNEDYRDVILRSIIDLGYTVDDRVIDCVDYGVAQHRKRWIMIARRDGGNPLWPDPLPRQTMAAALDWDDDLKDVNVGVMESLIEARVWGEPWHAVKLQHQSWCWERPSTTVSGRYMVTTPGENANRFNGKKKSRNDGVRLSIDDAKVLQGFPRSYDIVGGKTEGIIQVGNAFPAPVCEAMVRAQNVSR